MGRSWRGGDPKGPHDYHATSRVKTFPGSLPGHPDFPEMPVRGDSDHKTLMNYLAIPFVDFTYRNASLDSYPLYHTLYETPFLNEHIFDTHGFAVSMSAA